MTEGYLIIGIASATGCEEENEEGVDITPNQVNVENNETIEPTGLEDVTGFAIFNDFGSSGVIGIIVIIVLLCGLSFSYFKFYYLLISSFNHSGTISLSISVGFGANEYSVLESP